MDKIIEIERRSSSEKIHLQYLKYLYSLAENVSCAPEWENCFNIAMSKENSLDDNLEIILNTAAGKLQHTKTIATKIVKMTDDEINAIFVKTENPNVFKQYRRTQIAEMAKWVPGMNLQNVSISVEDTKAGSPKDGDMIARNPKNNNDKWLVAAQYFADNFEEI